MASIVTRATAQQDSLEDIVILVSELQKKAACLLMVKLFISITELWVPTISSEFSFSHRWSCQSDYNYGASGDYVNDITRYSLN